MKFGDLKMQVSNLLKLAGVSLDGSNPWDIQVHHPGLYSRVFREGSLGLGEAYMDGWWDCKRIDELFERLLKADLHKKLRSNVWLTFRLILLKILSRQTRKNALEVGRKHYDTGNELFKNMLDKRMNYTCGYWKYASNLDEAQLHKLDLTCQKLMLEPGMTLLDIGCGFGSLLKFASENYGVRGTGITISRKQYEYARNDCRDLPIEIRFQDYRDLNEKFDRIVSLGMFEHVGHLNHRLYMQIVKKCLKGNGLFLLHTIGNNITVSTLDRWTKKYIFPHGVIPSAVQISKAAEGLLIMEDWHNFGADYDKTLMAWHARFNQNWSHLKEWYDDRFYRMWSYYLLSCAGVFRARKLQLWQIVYSGEGVKGGYQATRLNLKPVHE